MSFSLSSINFVEVAAYFQGAAIFAHVCSETSLNRRAKDGKALSARVLQTVSSSLVLHQLVERLGYTQYAKLCFTVIPISSLAEKMLSSERQKEYLSRIQQNSIFISSLALSHLGQPMNGSLAVLAATSSLYFTFTSVADSTNNEIILQKFDQNSEKLSMAINKQLQFLSNRVKEIDDYSKRLANKLKELENTQPQNLLAIEDLKLSITDLHERLFQLTEEFNGFNKTVEELQTQNIKWLEANKALQLDSSDKFTGLCQAIAELKTQTAAMKARLDERDAVEEKTKLNMNELESLPELLQSAIERLDERIDGIDEDIKQLNSTQTQHSQQILGDQKSHDFRSLRTSYQDLIKRVEILEAERPVVAVGHKGRETSILSKDLNQTSPKRPVEGARVKYRSSEKFKRAGNSLSSLGEQVGPKVKGEGPETKKAEGPNLEEFKASGSIQVEVKESPTRRSDVSEVPEIGEQDLSTLSEGERIFPLDWSFE